MKADSERREKLRFRPKEATFVALRPNFVKLGKLLDINRDGLCFQYISRKDTIKETVSVHIDMFISSNGYYLPDVTCRLIYDKKIKKDSTHLIDLEYRRCGLQFDQLTRRQAEMLELYLQQHTETLEQAAS
jgi:hypothetical protein